MKYIILLLMLSFSLSASAQKYKYEEEVLESFYNSLPEQGKIFKTEFKKFEDYLIQNNIIGKGNGKDYLSLFINISSLQSLDFIKYKFIDSLNACNAIGKHEPFELLILLENKKLESFEKSRSNQITKSIDNLQSAIPSNEEIDTYEIIKSVLRPKDFEQEYFKTITLYSIGVMLQLEELYEPDNLGLYEQEVAPEEPAIKVLDRNLCVISVNKDNRIMLENREIVLDSLTSLVKEYIQYSGIDNNYPERELQTIPLLGDVAVSKLIVSIRNDRATSYDTYIKVQNAIVEAYKQAKNEFALEHFGKSFNDLSNDQQKAVKTAIPQKISEAEPTMGGE